MLDPAHINLTRDIVLMLGGLFTVWFVYMFVYFYVLERKRMRQ